MRRLAPHRYARKLLCRHASTGSAGQVGEGGRSGGSGSTLAVTPLGGWQGKGPTCHNSPLRAVEAAGASEARGSGQRLTARSGPLAQKDTAHTDTGCAQTPQARTRAISLTHSLKCCAHTQRAHARQHNTKLPRVRGAAVSSFRCCCCVRPHWLLSLFLRSSSCLSCYIHVTACVLPLSFSSDVSLVFRKDVSTTRSPPRAPRPLTRPWERYYVAEVCVRYDCCRRDAISVTVCACILDGWINKRFVHRSLLVYLPELRPALEGSAFRLGGNAIPRLLETLLLIS